MAYKVEPILDEHLLYLRIHKNDLFPDQTLKGTKKIMPGAFKPKEDENLSVDWSEHSTPHNSVKNPEAHGVVSFLVQEVRNPIHSLQVLHNPLCPPIHDIDNRAHSIIKGLPPKGPSKERMRIVLRDLCKWEIECPQ